MKICYSFLFYFSFCFVVHQKNLMNTVHEIVTDLACYFHLNLAGTAGSALMVRRICLQQPQQWTFSPSEKGLWCLRLKEGKINHWQRWHLNMSFLHGEHLYLDHCSPSSGSTGRILSSHTQQPACPGCSWWWQLGIGDTQQNSCPEIFISNVRFVVLSRCFFFKLSLVKQNVKWDVWRNNPDVKLLCSLWFLPFYILFPGLWAQLRSARQNVTFESCCIKHLLGINTICSKQNVLLCFFFK